MSAKHRPDAIMLSDAASAANGCSDPSAVEEARDRGWSRQSEKPAITWCGMEMPRLLAGLGRPGKHLFQAVTARDVMGLSRDHALPDLIPPHHTLPLTTNSCPVGSLPLSPL